MLGFQPLRFKRRSMAISIHRVALMPSSSARRWAAVMRWIGRRNATIRRGVSAVDGLPAPSRFPPRGILGRSFPRCRDTALPNSEFEPHLFQCEIERTLDDVSMRARFRENRRPKAKGNIFEGEPVCVLKEHPPRAPKERPLLSGQAFFIMLESCFVHRRVLLRKRHGGIRGTSLLAENA